MHIIASSLPSISRIGGRRRMARLLAVVLGLLSGGGVVYAQAPAAEVEAEAAPPRTGLAALVRVNLPLTSGADAPLKLTLARARDQLLAQSKQRGDGRRPVVVLRIAP